jgi:tetratricopeptide (TPR) repeat protein
LHLWAPSTLYIPDLNAEIGEMLFGIAVATLALGIVLNATSGEQRPGATASLPIISMILIGGIFTAVFVNSYRGYGNLRQHLNRRAASDLPSLGMHRQALMLFDYIHNNPHLSRPETRFRHALLLMKLDGNGKARPLLELVAAEQERLANEQPEDPEPFRVKGHALLSLERREEANASFTKAIENDRNLLSSTDNLQSRARIHFSLAKTFHAMGDFDRAKEQISEARRLRSDRMLPMLIDRWLSEEMCREGKAFC